MLFGRAVLAVLQRLFVASSSRAIVLTPRKLATSRFLCTLRRMCRRRPDVAALRLLHQNAPSNVCGPMHTVMQTLKWLKWVWDDFDTFQRPFLPPIAWMKCSKGWFKRQVRNALRQVQMSTLASRATHYFGLQFFDRDSKVFLLNKFLSKNRVTRLAPSKQSWPTPFVLP